MIVEIHGAGFRNKGAELMLRATLSELRKRMANTIPAIDPLYGAYELRCELGLRQIIPPRSHVGTPGFSKRFRMQRWFSAFKGPGLFKRLFDVPLDLYGMVDISRVQGFVDISGFAYTDQWGTQPTLDLAVLTEYYKRHKKPVILLPQAFGPFERSESQAAFSEALSCADLVFARDRQSWEYAAAITSESGKILQAPDITLFYPRTLSSATKKISDYVCLIPNVRILDQGKLDWAHQYMSYLRQSAIEILELGFNVLIVIHDSSGADLQIAQRIETELQNPRLRILQEENPVALKEIIGQSILVIGSRYHSLVAAFSQRVPSIALGWSHKYQELYKDFECPELVLDAQSNYGELKERFRSLLDDRINQDYRLKIEGRLASMRAMNEHMWQRVIEVLGSACS